MAANITVQPYAIPKWNQQRTVAAVALATIMTSIVLSAVAINLKFVKAYGLQTWKQQFALKGIAVPSTLIAINFIGIAVLLNKVMKESPVVNCEKGKTTWRVSNAISGAYVYPINLRPGDRIENGSVLFECEVMKIKQMITTQFSGVVTKVFSPGATVCQKGTPLIEVQYDQKQTLSGLVGQVEWFNSVKEGAVLKAGEAFGKIHRANGQEELLRLSWPIQIKQIHVQSGSSVDRQNLLEFIFVPQES